MSDHARRCPMSGSYTVTTCPCCGRRITAHRPKSGHSDREIEQALRRRPPSGPVDELGEHAS